MTTYTIAANLRHLVLGAIVAGAALLGATAIGDLATASAKPTGPVIIMSDGPSNCARSGGVWVWDGFEVGHCERRTYSGVLTAR